MTDDDKVPAPRTSDFKAGGKLQAFIPSNFEEARWVAAAFARGGDMVPNVYRGNPEACLLAIMAGSELGLSPQRSLQYIAPINGRATLWGDALPALLQAQEDQHGRKLFELEEWFEGSGDDMVAHCKLTRRGSKPVERTFGVDDAKRAGLWQTEAIIERRGRDGKPYKTKNDSPWFRYPQRMLQMRARSWAVRDGAADVLAGLAVREEVVDTPQRHSGPDSAKDITPEASSLRNRVARAAAADKPAQGNKPGEAEKPPEPEADDAELVDDESPRHIPGEQLDMLDSEQRERDAMIAEELDGGTT